MLFYLDCANGQEGDTYYDVLIEFAPNSKLYENNEASVSDFHRDIKKLYNNI